jgi:hypothetical protein
MRINKLMSCLLLFGALLTARAQEPAAALNVLPEATTPSHLSGDAPSLATRTDPDYRNILVGGATFGASFDTAGYIDANGNTVGDARFFGQPSIAFRQTYPTANWTLSYTPGVSVSQHDTDSTQYTQNMAADGSWKVTPRLTLHARQDYSISTNPFESVGRVALLPDLGGYFGPNYDGVIPNSKRTAMVSNADVSYRLTAHLAVGITGGYQQFNYTSLDNSQLAAAGLIDSTVINGSVFLSDEISRRQTLGVQAAYMDIYSYGEQQSRVQAPAVLLFDTIKFTPHQVLTVYAGPEYARSSGLVPVAPPIYAAVLQRDWHPTAGVTYAWSGTQDALVLDFSRRISSGGGLMAASTMTYGSAAFRSKLTKRWTTEVRVSADNQDALDLFDQNTYFRTIWTGGGLVREVNRNFSIRLDGAYIRQTGTGLGFVPGNHGLVQITFDVHFMKGLGR